MSTWPRCLSTSSMVLTMRLLLPPMMAGYICQRPTTGLTYTDRQSVCQCQRSEMNKNVERGQATRAHLVEVATRLFTAHGYDGTSIEMVLAETGVSRGSLYHHFQGKDALFWAVLEGVGSRIGAEISAAVGKAPDPIAGMRIDCLAWIRLAGDPVVQQTVLIDAPTVLGWQRWREINEQSNLGWFRADLRYAADAGLIDEAHVDVF